MTNGLKILHLLYESKGDPFGVGGVGMRAYAIYAHLRERHDITLLCKKYPGAHDGEIDGLKHLYVGTESKNFTKTLLSYAYHASRFVRKYGHEFEIIIEEFSPAIPTFLGLFRKRPLVLQIQGYTGKHYFEKYNLFYSGILYLFERFLPLFYKNIIVVSEAAGRRYHLESRDKNVTVLSNGVERECLLHEPEESNYILYLGRIDIHHKGLDLLLSACANLFSIFPHIRLLIAGDGRDAEQFLAMLKELPASVRQNITMTGWVDGQRKMLLLRDALFVVVPSRYETQGIVALEAMACGKAIVSSDIPELNYIPSNGAGIAFPSGDAGALASAMKDLILRSDRSLMGQKGREWVTELTWDRIAMRYENFLYAVYKNYRE
ncbi:MAG: glycosyltransferase family 4 protein [Thermodesulfovibrionales bacterium]|jgi:glycosyltransferase involved in cell wall biosynthesis